MAAPPSPLVHWDRPATRQDVIQLILQYLHSEGYVDTVSVIQDETGIKFNSRRYSPQLVQKIKKSILGKSMDDSFKYLRWRLGRSRKANSEKYFQKLQNLSLHAVQTSLFGIIRKAGI